MPKSWMTAHDRWRTVALWCAAFTPFAFALIADARGPQPAPMSPADRPALAFEQYLVNLGPVEPEPYVFARFRFVNRSDRDVSVTKLEPSCGCLQPQLKQRNYGPGEQGEFFLRVQTASEEPGTKEYFVDLHYDDPQPREVRLSLKVQLPDEKVVIRPKALAFYQFSDAPTVHEIEIYDFRQHGLKITAVESSSPHATAVVGETDIDADGTRRQKVIVRVAGDMPSGQHRGLITIHTDDPARYNKLTVPLLIIGRAQQATASRPASPR